LFEEEHVDIKKVTYRISTRNAPAISLNEPVKGVRRRVGLRKVRKTPPSEAEKQPNLQLSQSNLLETHNHNKAVTSTQQSIDKLSPISISDCTALCSISGVHISKTNIETMTIKKETNGSSSTCAPNAASHAGNNIAKWTTTHLCFPDSDTCRRISSLSPFNRRSVHIPNRFDTLASYRNTFIEALNEEINLQLFSIAEQWYKLLLSLNPTLRKPSKELERRFRARNVNVYFHCELVKGATTAFPSYRKMKGLSEDATDKKAPLFIVLDKDSREHYTKYAKDDIWIVSSNLSFTPQKSSDIFLIARSVYHGPTYNGLIEIKLVSGDLPPLSATQTTPVYAIHGPNCSTEFAMIDNLMNLHLLTFPLITMLLSGPSCTVEACDSHENVYPHRKKSNRCKVNLSLEHIKKEAMATAEKWNLNEDQLRVLLTVSEWICADSGADVSCASSPQDVLLVHGVFGSGKSHLLTILIMFLCSLFDAAQSKEGRILVSAATNVAVDRILLGLVENDFKDFIRVGSLKRIAKPILPYTLHREKATEGNKFDEEKEQEATIKELQEMLSSPTVSSQDRTFIKQAIEDIRAGKMRQRAEKLKKVRVVGMLSSLNDSVKRPILNFSFLLRCHLCCCNLSCSRWKHFSHRYS